MPEWLWKIPEIYNMLNAGKMAPINVMRAERLGTSK